MSLSALRSIIRNTTFGVLALIQLGGVGGCVVSGEATAMKESEIVRQYLYQHWMHSYEEDTESEMVYRPAAFAFPPSRGRTGFEFSPGGVCTVIGIAPTDGSQKSDCRWDLDDADDPRIIIYSGSGETHTLYVRNVEKDKLVVLKK